MGATAEVVIEGQPNAVTHGADDRLPPRPQGLVAQLSPEVAWPCEGTGQDGRRVQMLYVHTGTGNLNANRANFEAITRRIEGTFLTSARKTGGERLVRFVTSPTCALSILDVTVSQSAISSFDQMISELAAQGLNRRDRIYHSWVEGDTFCGIGTVYTDDKPTNNLNEQYAQYSRSDRNCWNYAEAHEILHNLGGVQNTAPNATGGLHCRDESDQMCYADGAPKGQMVQVCPIDQEDLLDCRNDDYFSTAPSGYLASHWNTADSSALTRGVTSTSTTTTSTTSTTVPPTTSTSTTVPPTTVPPTTTTSTSTSTSTTSTTTGNVDTKTSLVLPKTIKSGESFPAFAIVTGDCEPTGTVGFYISGRLMSRQVLHDGLASVTLTVTGTVSRPTFRADYFPAEGSTCEKSRATVRKTVKQ